MRYDFEPEKKEKVRLFAHSGEAIVFWLCVGGLVLWTLASIFRYVQLRTVVEKYQDIGQNVSPLNAKIEMLKSDNKNLNEENQNLHSRVSELENKIDSLNSAVSRLRPRTQPSPQQNTGKRESAKKTIILPIE